MTHKEMLKLKEFLNENFVFEQFCSNLQIERAISYLKETRETTFEIFCYSPLMTLKDAIKSAFVWYHTPEGCDYWLEISKKWKSYLSSENFLKK